MATSLPTYTGDMTALVRPTGHPVTDALIVGSKWGTGGAGTGATVTFSFPDAVDKFDKRDGVAGNYNPAEQTQGGYAAYLQGFVAFGAAEQAAARQVLASWAAVANLQLVEVAATTVDAGVLRFGYTGGLGGTTYAVSAFPQDFAGAGDTWMNRAFLFPEGWAAGTQNFLTLLHEVGHAIGLKHPHDTGMSGEPGWPVNPAVLPKIGEDTLTGYSTQNMVMAYNDIPGMGAPLQADFAPTTPMKVDIDAIQYLYGPNLAHNAGDTVYTYESAVRYNETVWDGGGNDTIEASGMDDVGIDLTPGSWSIVGAPLTFSERDPATLAVVGPRPDLTDPFTVYIYDTVLIENAIGGGGNDILLGNLADNRLQGGAGNDALDGALGIDLAIYSAARAGAAFSVTATGFTVTSAADGTDALANVERLRFADTSVALDLPGNAGMVAKILGSVFGRDAVSNEEYAGIGLYYIDGGMSYESLMQLAIDARLGAGASHHAVVDLLYTNVVGVPPGDVDRGYFVGLLDSGVYTVAGLGVMAADIDLNVANINLVGLAQQGLEYVPYLGG
ncbi:MAG: M10 family metallopeptidase [Betaproteobacteria bacterium]|nr:M10 family metallopeptidase [Betaproteobacteria bacterium]